MLYLIREERISLDSSILLLEKEDWLSNATREKAIEKLNGMKLYALYPDHFKDFSGLDFAGKSMEEMYGIIGYVLAHEMSHCFDKTAPILIKTEK